MGSLLNVAHSNAMRRCLEECDVAGIRNLWREIAPNMPQPESDAEALAALHRARTDARSVAFKLRAYSHCWLKDHGLPSGLPDELRPRAERMHPRVVEAVGISANFRSPILRPAKPIIERAMSDAVEDCYAERRTDPAFVRSQIMTAKDKAMRKLFGALIAPGD